MINSVKFILPLATVVLFTITSCQKDNPDNWGTIKKLYKTYKNGEISECTLDGEAVFVCALNAHDAGTIIYNESGKEIGNCNFAWGTVDDVCSETINCETIYRVDDNIWGRKYVDKYGLE